MGDPPPPAPGTAAVGVPPPAGATKGGGSGRAALIVVTILALVLGIAITEVTHSWTIAAGLSCLSDSSSEPPDTCTRAHDLGAWTLVVQALALLAIAGAAVTKRAENDAIAFVVCLVANVTLILWLYG